MIRWLAVGLLLGLGACARNQVNDTRNEAASATFTPVITLERTACFGSCPVYHIAASSSGEVRYEGKAHVRKLGSASSKVPPERVAALLSELEQAGYFNYADRYTPAEPACGRYATDSPSAISSVTLAGRTKQVTHDYGCGGAPAALVVLERRIDEVLNSSQWTGR